MQDLYINSYVSIKNNAVNVNGEETLFESNSIPEFCKNAYKSLNINYPKFYKMDKICKLGFLATEFLLINQEKDTDTSLIFANQSSSLDTDIKYQESIQETSNFIPSPSVFVYTLPNIVLGEISIRNKFTGENIFLVLEKLKPEIMLEVIFLQKKLNKASNFILTWIEVIENKIEVYAFYIESKERKNSLILNENNINHLIKNTL